MRRRIFIHWGLSSFFGFGVYGLNLTLAWARDPDLEPVTVARFDPRQIQLDPLRMHALQPVLATSAALARLMRAQAPPGETIALNAPVLVSDLGGALAPNDGPLVGHPTIAVPFLEDAAMADDLVASANRHALVVAGSDWNARLLRAHGVERVTTVLQGVDPTLFHPAPRAGVLADRFTVFSGGKLERRKGQDLVLAAFRRFAAGRPDALLVTAWHSPWPRLARTLDDSGLVAPVRFAANGQVDVAAWAAASDVPAGQVLDLGAIPNAALPPVLREMDVALFPNRAEGGTNLVAMEAMACGVPVVLSANTGHLDLVDGDNAYVLETQAIVAGQEGPPGVGGWGESQVDEIVERLEQAYLDREDARRRGQAGARKLAGLTWSRSAAALKAEVLGACG